MKIGKTLYVNNRGAWRAWLRKYHNTRSEIWLIYYKKDSGKQRIPYNDAVEEALCFGWIDSIVKSIDKAKYAQRFSPRKKGSKWSAMNKERVRRLIKLKRMTPAGLEKFENGTSSKGNRREKNVIPPDILKALQRDNNVWKNFQKFPESYKRIRIGWIDASRNRAKAFRQRLRYFVRMTAQNKRFGMVQ